MLQPDQTIAVCLTLDQWQKIINLMAEAGPWRIVNPLINEVGQQVETAAMELGKANGAIASGVIGKPGVGP